MYILQWCTGKVPDDECQISALKLKNGFKIMMMGSLEKDIEDASAPPEEMPEVVNDLDIEEEEIAIESREVSSHIWVYFLLRLIVQLKMLNI